jgi:dTDP-4-amino-4,6-dideoxygalactose transaminase
MSKVPLLDVNAQNLPLEAEMLEACARVLRSGQMILGPEVQAFESEVAAFAGVQHAVALSSGTDALLAALMALGIGPGDEVLVPAFTFFATAGCVARLGAVPVFVDSCPVCCNLDTNDAETKVTERTRAIIPVHLFGQAADMDAVMALAREFGLRVVEDAAQAIGAEYRGQACGSIGDCGTYSFYPSKNLGGLGDGGMLVTNDAALAGRVRVLRNHGMEPKYFHRVVGGNFRLDALQCVLLRVKLPRLREYEVKRAMNAAYYTQTLSREDRVFVARESHCKCAAAQAAELESAKAKLVLPVAYPHVRHVWNQYTIRVLGSGRRDALRQHLTARGIGSEIYYPLTLDQQECFAHLPESSRVGCSVAHDLASEVLSLPVYPELTDEQREAVVAAVIEFLDGR